MATPAQAAAATVGAGSLAAAGAYGITQAVNGSGEEQTTEESENQQNNSIPTPEATFTNDDVSKAPYTGKLISIFKETNLPYLVKSEGNEEWWKWAFENKYSKNKTNKSFDSLFNNLTTSDSLKAACDSAYKENKDKYKFEQTDHLLQNISDYCTKSENSVDISEPRVTFYTGSVTGYTNGLLSVDANKTKLVKTTVAASGEDTNYNEIWWNWAFKKIYTTKTESTSTNFANVNKGYNTSDANALSKVCDESYKKNYSELKASNWALLKDIKKFCTLNTQDLVLLLPEPTTKTTLANDTGYSVASSLIKKSTNHNKLIDPTKNEDWWEWSFTHNYPKGDDVKKAKLLDPFKNVNNAYVASGDNTYLNQACKASYDKLKADLEKAETGGTKLLDQIKKFCAPTSTTSLDLPD